MKTGPDSSTRRRGAIRFNNELMAQGARAVSKTPKPQIGYYGFIMHISINLILGVLAIAYGSYCFIQRKVAPEKIKKLQSLIERNGEEMGHSIHLFGHTIVPIVAGLLLIFAHYRV